jgi:hypothetical protein
MARLSEEEKDRLILQRRSLRRRGFDGCRLVRSEGTAYWRVGRSQCEAAVINGPACHEQGCPNSRRTR